MDGVMQKDDNDKRGMRWVGRWTSDRLLGMSCLVASEEGLADVTVVGGCGCSRTLSVDSAFLVSDDGSRSLVSAGPRFIWLRPAGARESLVANALTVLQFSATKRCFYPPASVMLIAQLSLLTQHIALACSHLCDTAVPT